MRQTTWGTGAEGVAHDQAQIEGTDVDQGTFEGVVTVAQMDAAQRSGLQTVGEGSFEDLASTAK